MSVPMKPEDPAYWMLEKGKEEAAADPANYTWRSKPVVYRAGCYICEDPEFSLLGMPLCYACPACKDGHVPADDIVCDDCDFDVSSQS